jgi:gp6
MSNNNFVPEVWSASILENFHNQSVLTGLTNREYESELSSGSKILIAGITDIKVKDYKTGVIPDAGGSGMQPRTTAPDTVASTGIELTVDQEKSFDFLVDDIDRAQANKSFDKYTESAGLGLVEDTESFLTAMLSTQGTAVTGLTTPTDWASAYKIALALRGKLTDAKVPQAGRVLLVNGQFETHLLSDGSKLAAFDTSNTTDGLREATIGRLLGFDVVVSSWMDNIKPMAIALHKPSVAYVSQISEIESMRAEHTFADRIRGMHVYGGKVLRPTAVQVFKGV